MVSTPTKSGSMASAKRILLVDESAVPRHSLAEQLAREGAYAVIEAVSAAEARQAKDYVFAIIDAATGESQSLAREFGGRGVPVLLLTENEPGGRDSLVKPFRLAI